MRIIEIIIADAFTPYVMLSQIWIMNIIWKPVKFVFKNALRSVLGLPLISRYTCKFRHIGLSRSTQDVSMVQIKSTLLMLRAS